MNLTRTLTFRSRLRERRTLVGTFLKTPSIALTEIIGLSGLDCVCIDAEHAPFDRQSLDAVILAARAHDLPCLVRVPDTEPATLLNVLDLGAVGIVAPHVTSPQVAQRIAQACRFGGGGRGYAGSTRAAGYTTRGLSATLTGENASVCVIAQIEDAAALEQIDEIAALEAIDCLFIGRMDLTVSLGASSADEPQVIAAVQRICDAGRRHERCTGMFTATTAEALRWRSEGAALFLLGSDQQWVLQGARDLAGAFKSVN